MPHPWKPCGCDDCAACEDGVEHVHAHVELDDNERPGRRITLRVPWAARADSIGWGAARRVRSHLNQQPAMVLAEGPRGVTALHADGHVSYLHSGTYDDEPSAGFGAAPAADMVKAMPLKAGQRWITVHPNGPGTPGHALLIQQNQDGTHRVMAGAGGKLNHLILSDVKSPEEHAAKAKAAREERKAKERKELEQLTPEQRKERKAQDKLRQGLLRSEKEVAELQFIKDVEQRLGGIAKPIDLEDPAIKGASPAIRKELIRQNHKMRLAQAEQRATGAREALVDAGVRSAEEHAAVERALAVNPSVVEEAKQLADEIINERIANETAKARRTTAKGSRLSDDELAMQLEGALGEHGDPAARLDELEGAVTPSARAERESLQEIVKAKALVAAAQGETLDPQARAIVDAMAVEGKEQPDKAQLIDAAHAALAKSEAKAARSVLLAQVEKRDGVIGAERVSNAANLLATAARDREEAKKLGLSSADKLPVVAPEVAELRDVLASERRLLAARKSLDAVNKATPEAYLDARKAWHVELADYTGEVDLGIHEEIQRKVTEQLVGQALQGRPEYLDAVAAGQYDASAEVAQALTGGRVLDRIVLDGVGNKNAAILTRWAAEQRGVDIGAALGAVEEHHVERLVKLSQAAMAKAEDILPGWKDAVEGVDDIERHIRRLDLAEAQVREVQQAIGSAIGRMEATAAIGQAMRSGVPDALEISVKKGAEEGHFRKMVEMGLRPGDYQFEGTEQGGVIRIPQSSWSRLTMLEDKAVLKARRTANEIKGGLHDEAGWLPEGITRRTATSFTDPSTEKPRYFVPPNPTPAGLEEHVGSRLADGEQPAAIMGDLLTPTALDAAPDRAAYLDQVRKLFPIQREDGSYSAFDEHAEHFRALAEGYMSKKYGSIDGAFHAQNIRVDDPETRESVFRALAAHPTAVAAMRPLGDLTHKERAGLRDHLSKALGVSVDTAGDEAEFERKIQALGAEPNPDAGTMGLFGGGGPSPEWQDYQRQLGQVLAEHPRTGLETAIKRLGERPAGSKGVEWDLRVASLREAGKKQPSWWQRYTEAHGSTALAYSAIQDMVKSDFIHRFAEEHGRHTKQGLRQGVADVTNREIHVKATASPEEAAKITAEAQRLYAQIRQRVGGQFAQEGEGALIERARQVIDDRKIGDQLQGGLFGASPKNNKPPPLATPGKGQRWSIGEQAENQLASVVRTLGEGFQPGKPVDLYALNMDDGRIDQQRVIKMLEQNGGRMGAWLGTGSGKTPTAIGAFAHLHALGRASHGLFVTPSAVEQQFGEEMLRFTEPGKFRFATAGGMDAKAKRALLTNTDVHMRVMTHQAFRDTAVAIMAEHHKMEPADVLRRLADEDPKVGAKLMREAFDAAGIPKHFTTVDEAHMASWRDDPSGIAAVMRAATHPMNSSAMMLASATPHKNDADEVHAMASLLDPDHYADRVRFLRNFGPSLGQNTEAIRRELAHLTYSAKIPPKGIDRIAVSNPVVGSDGRKVARGPLKLLPEHQKLVDGVTDAYQRAQKARDAGRVDVDALKALSPGAFTDAPEADHERIAKSLVPALGVVRDAAMRRAINAAPVAINSKLQALADCVEHDVKRGTWNNVQTGKVEKGKPSIIFADRLGETALVVQALKERGLRVAHYHGGLSREQKEKIRRGFQPPAGVAPEYDVFVSTSAAEAGVNLQRAKVVHHYDIPITPKSHNQRDGRAHRQKQLGNVDIHDWVTDTEFDRNAQRRLARKQDIADVFETPMGNLDEQGLAHGYQARLAANHEFTDTTALGAA